MLDWKTCSEALRPFTTEIRDQRFLCLEPPRPAAFNMQADSLLLSLVESLSRPTTWVRLYGWERPTVSFGRFQDPTTALNSEVCSKLGLDTIRRPTGGRAVLHDVEVTYSVASNDTRLFGSRRLSSDHRAVSMAIKKGLDRIGIRAAIAGHNPPREELRDRRAPCFAATTRAEILVSSRKLVGSAQRRGRRSFLQHGSIPLVIDYQRMALALGCSSSLLRSSMISVEEARGRATSKAALIDAMTAAFSDFLADESTCSEPSGKPINKKEARG